MKKEQQKHPGKYDLNVYFFYFQIIPREKNRTNEKWLKHDTSLTRYGQKQYISLFSL